MLHECHLLGGLLPWGKSPVVWRAFVGVLVQQRSRVPAAVSAQLCRTLSVCHPDPLPLQKLCWICFVWTRREVCGMVTTTVAEEDATRKPLCSVHWGSLAANKELQLVIAAGTEISLNHF